jgi:hypothetical protein
VAHPFRPSQSCRRGPICVRIRIAT